LLGDPLRRALRRVVELGAYAYPILLVAIAFLLHFVGEDWWVTALASYLPALGFALPLPFIVLGLFAFRMKRLWWTQVVAALLVLVPLMGFVLPWFAPGRSGGPMLRVVSFNVNQGYFGYDKVVSGIREFSPDLVLVQESVDHDDLVKRLKQTYQHVHASTQFVMASRFPLVETTDPARIPYYDRQRSPRFMRYVIDSSIGRLAIYNVHPISPRGTLGAWNFRAAVHLARKGAALEADAASDVAHNMGLRRLQVEAAGRMASSEKLPVVIGGDFNLPGTSPVLRRNLGGFRDAYRAASSGFGYSYPSKFPWLRLDRIYTTRDLEAVSFSRGCHGASDHHCVFAEIQRSAE
jgi:vancomycin resistance protein VanJ